MWNFYFLSYSDKCVQELYESHIDMLIFFDFIDLRHHSLVILITDLSRAKILR